MIRMIWMISLRNMLKQKVYTIINVLGLALGFTAIILIGLFIRYELNWVIILITTSFQTIKASRRNPAEALRYE